MKIEKKKNKKMIVGMVVLLFLIAVLVVVATVNSSDRRLGHLLELGQRYLDEMDYEQAVAAFTEAIEIDPNCRDAYIGRGDAYNGLGGEENMFLALDDYQMAMELDETNSAVYISIANIYLAQDRSDAACDILRQGREKAENKQSICNMLDDITEQEAKTENTLQIWDIFGIGNINENVNDEEDGGENDEVNDDENSEENSEEYEYENVFYVHTGGELEALLEQEGGLSECTIVLDGKDYYVSDACVMSGAHNVTILGTEGTRLLCSSGSDLILSIWECSGIVLKNLVIGHDIPTGDLCEAGVMSIGDSEVSVVNCDIFGCGVEGFHASHSSLIFENTIIRDCSSGIMECTDITAEFINCSFSGNGYDEWRWTNAIDLWTYEVGNMLTFSGCIFENNQNPVLVNEEEAGSVKFENCTFTRNAWD